MGGENQRQKGARDSLLGFRPSSTITTTTRLSTTTHSFRPIKRLHRLTVFYDCSATRGRVYQPQDELAKARLSDDDIFRGKVTDKRRRFMKGQIKRARMFFDEAEKGVAELNPASRWPVWASSNS
ncbi:hypothetical protein LR48_Vigan08g085600 [Vigna angularis]|uniref:15-cis-phytoene synthase n=1 Tax=Phaseolus angularis TaxID=3914 RepID=A0A0L9V5U0_PHAAN|nr:hypothetical protein LR48_Vigan08g085600 [Vigna angularis]